MQNVKKYIESNIAVFRKTLKELCLIPAPSHHEEDRAAYCKAWFEKNGAADVYIDDALNVIFPINCNGKNDITVIVAHTDTVFPDKEPMPYREEGGKIFCPGVGDDTASLTALLYTAKYFIENDIKPLQGVMFVCNSCEEGLGNLKGTRQLFKDYNGRIGRFISFDSGSYNNIYTDCVGSHRYKVTVKTEGGHSYGKFGNKNALAELSKIITDIYSIEVPKKGDSKTTYNVGTVSGGTSVNTIAEEATMLCEYRSSNIECLNIMKKKYEEIFANAKTDEVSVTVEQVGDRPCMGDVDQKKQSSLIETGRSVIEKITGTPAITKSASTDCNIPLSLGIPAICIGTYNGDGAHTRGEWVDESSLDIGLEVAIDTVSAVCRGEKI